MALLSNPNFGPNLDAEYDFVWDVLGRHNHLSDKKIEFIKAFRKDTGYGLLEAKNIVESYLGSCGKPTVFEYLQNSIVIPNRNTDASLNSAIPEVYLVISDGSKDYTAYSKEEAKRVRDWLVNMNMSNVRVCVEVKF